MKTFIRILSVIAMMFTVACSEDMIGHDGEDGLNGKDGTNGTNGHNGLSTRMYFDELSQNKIYYLDVDASSSFTSVDTVLWEEPKEGITLSRNDSGCVKITETIGTVETSYLVCDGETGPQGPKGDSGTSGQDGEDGQDGQPGSDGKTVYVYPPFQEDCNTGSSWHYKDLGWNIIGTPYSINHYIDYINYASTPNGNGTLVLDEYDAEPAIVYGPSFEEPSAVDYFSCDIGSSGEWEVSLIFMRGGPNIPPSFTTVKVDTTIQIKDFVWYDKSTWGQKFVYKVDLNDIQFQDVIRFGLTARKIGDFSIPANNWRNYTLNIDNIYVHRVKILN